MPSLEAASTAATPSAATASASYGMSDRKSVHSAAMPAFLETPEVQSIQFRLGHIAITPAGFCGVAQAMRSGKIECFVRPVELADGGAGAAYSSARNEFYFKSLFMLDTPEKCGVFVHEATHAMMDLQRKTSSRLHSEGAAFIATAWYLLNVGQGDLIDNEETREIATALRDEYLGTKSAPSASTDQIFAMRSRMVERGYKAGIQTRDGI